MCSPGSSCGRRSQQYARRAAQVARHYRDQENLTIAEIARPVIAPDPASGSEGSGEETTGRKAGTGAPSLPLR